LNVATIGVDIPTPRVHDVSSGVPSQTTRQRYCV
jgi:hypothetical protein